MSDPWLGTIPVRRLVETPVLARFRIGPGDRPLVAPGETVVDGAPLAERYRDPRLDEVEIPDGVEVAPGDRIDREDGRRRRRGPTGELLYAWRRRWRVATGEILDPLDSPIAGIVRDVARGTAITVAAAGHGIRGTAVVGQPTRGRLAIAGGPDGDLRSGAVDVGLAGTILVVRSRVDAEALTRARAMGIAGVIVGALAGKERRDLAASEARQRAALHRIPPFAVLVLDGSVRRALPGPLLELLEALAGREVAIIADPPMLVFDGPVPEISTPPDRVRIRGGAHAGREGRWAGALGPRRFAGGVHLEAAAVVLDDGTRTAVPLGDLERFA